MSGVPSEPIDDVIARRRALVRRWCGIGKRVGYGAILVAIVVFAIGAVSNFSQLAVVLIVGCFALSALTLIPAVIFGYGVTMAEREERGEPFAY